jgi:hypothetical protein
MNLAAASTIIDEPLEALSGFAFDWAHCLCDPSQGCSPYHKAWSIVRFIEADGALPAGLTFFTEQLAPLARDGRIRVLLSGAADTGLAALVLRALRPNGIEPEIIMVDRCLTTLEQNRLFARHAGFSLEAIHQSATELETQPVDAIIVHSFLGFFAPEDRQSVVDMWARNLAPHGRVLMSNRLSSGQPKVKPVPEPAALAKRVADFGEKMRNMGFSATRAEALSTAAEQLWCIRIGNPQLGEAELKRLLENAGLCIQHIAFDETAKTVSPIIMQADAKRRARAEVVVGHKT